MDPTELIDAQFEKAVSIVQGLPKTGPIQTGYEDKLAMYSLYKQATVGNVKSPRPGMFDMLGRAKWDAWAKHKDVASHEAKWLYVETLLKVLRKYSDKTIARDLARQLESYGDLGGSFTHLSQIRRSSPSRSSGSESAVAASRLLNNRLQVPHAEYNNTSEEEATDEGELTAENETTDDERDEARPLPGAASQGEPSFRSPSSLSSHMRYRTPMAGSTFSPPPMVPAIQPMPGFSTPSAFGGSASPAGLPSSVSASTYVAPGTHSSSITSYPLHLTHSSAGPSAAPQPQNIIPQRSAFQIPSAISPNYSDSRPPVERAVENVQAHIAALAERVEVLESIVARRQQAGVSSSSLTLGSTNTFFGGVGPDRPWDPAQMGLWSLVMAPLSRVANSLRSLAFFLAYVPAEDDSQIRDPRHRRRGKRFPVSSPVLLMVRRLMLDASFILTVLGMTTWIWRKTGLRRREVYMALGVLWRALSGAEAGPRKGRTMVDKGV